MAVLKESHDASEKIAIESILPQPIPGAMNSDMESANTNDDPEARPKCFKNLLAECFFVLTTTFAIGQMSLINGVLTVMTSTMQEALNMNSAEVTWLVSGLSLSSGAFLIFFGRVADLFGRRSMLVYSMASFTVLMLVTGFSQNALMAEILLAVAGLTCASVVPPAIGKLGAIYEKPSQRKNRAFACFSAGNPIGFVLGAMIGGVVNVITSWRACFFVVAVLYAFLTVAAWFTTPDDAEQSVGRLNWDTMKQMDWIGAFLIVTGIGLFTAAFTLTSDAPRGWATPYVIVLLVLGVLLMSVFLYWQHIFKYPLMPLHVWKDRNFSLLVAALCLGFAGFSSNFFWLCLGWQRAYLDSPLIVAVKVLPATIGGVLVNIVAALLMHRVSNKILFIIAATATCIASALLSPTSKSISYWALEFPSLLFAVIGADISFCVTNLYVMSSLPPQQQSVAGAMFQTATRLATTIGLGISTTFFAAAGGSIEVSRDAPWRPYQATFWVALVGAVLGLALTPFLSLGTQGHKEVVEEKNMIDSNKLQSGDEKRTADSAKE